MSNASVVRPHLTMSTVMLKHLVAAHWEDPVALQNIHNELTYRHRLKAQRLRAVVEARLIAIAEESFPWPNTAVVPAREAFSRQHWNYTQGMLSFLGYAVGRNGLPKNKRQAILNYVFNEAIPVVQSIEYTKQWSIPKSGTRLRKLALCIANFYKNGKRRDSAGIADMSSACSEWLEDLDYAKKTFYLGRFDFEWPKTTL